MSSSQQVPLTEELLEYLLQSSDPLPALVGRARDRAADLELPSMQVAPDQALLMRFVLRSIAAKNILEIGTFLGLSALVMTDAMGPDGRVLCLDRSAEWTDQALDLWQEAGVADRIDLRLGDAHETLAEVDGAFDAVFIDADKTGYLDYLEKVTPLLRSGGVLMVDNTLWYGKVVDPDDTSESTMAIREFNATLAADPRYDVTMVAVGDGLTLARKL